MIRIRRWRAVVVLVTLSAVPVAIGARFAPAQIKDVPVERVTTNLERAIEERPNDVELLVNLARIHAMAYAKKTTTVPMASEQGGPWLGQGVPPYKQFPVESTSDVKRQAVARDHLRTAIARYREALILEPANDVAALGLGWALIEIGDTAAAIPVFRDLIARSWPLDQAPDSSTDRRRPTPMYGQPFLTEEAARYLIPLLDPARDAAEIATLRSRAAALEKLMRWITPIAIPLADGLTAQAIEDHAASVPFDADGSGLATRWTWIRSNAAWLVFDHRRTGTIDSGLQLFGSVTFWLFWDNGYDALRALDDSGDGEIRGAELDGLALWHDRNGNGVSERGEVRPVAAWRIVALSTRYEHDPAHPDEIAFSGNGVTFMDGRVRPTYDVILRHAPAPKNLRLSVLTALVRGN